MKKAVLIFVLLFSCSFFIPFILINYEFEDVDVELIRLLITDSGEIVELSFDDYIKGVLIGEVPATYEDEALRAQAVVARTYTMNKLLNSSDSHVNADMCDDINHCQAYKSREYAFNSWDDSEEDLKWSKISNAVESTSGEVITYDGYLINAFFHAHSGGQTESAKFIWGNEDIPYLKSVSGEESYDFLDSVTIAKVDFVKLLKEKYLDYNGELNLEVVDKTVSDRVFHLRVGNKTLLGTDIRSLLGLRSTNFEFVDEGENIIFKTVGYGHGVGMSQEGANCMAIKGSSYLDIIKHYYSGVIVEKRY